MISPIRGYCFLKEVLGPQAFAKIDVERLDIRRGGLCALGQLFGSYDTGREALKLTDEETVYYGFNVDPDMAESESEDDYCYRQFQQLTEMWKQLLHEDTLLLTYNKHGTFTSSKISLHIDELV